MRWLTNTSIKRCLIAAVSVALSDGARDSSFLGKTLTPHMAEHDMACFYQLMANATCYREFGSGGSTVQAVAFPNLKRIVSTESDRSWVETLSQRGDIKRALRSKRLTLAHVDIGAVKEWGWPKDVHDHTDLFPAYSSADGPVAQADPPLHFDLVFVDGRFRVACLLKALAAITPEQRVGTRLVMHDYKNRLDSYKFVENFVELTPMEYPRDVAPQWVAKAHADAQRDAAGLQGQADDILGVFRKRADVDEAALRDAIRQYETEPMF